MSLPKITQPLFEIEVPSLGKKLNFRAFLVKEEKILFSAQQSQNKKDIIRAIKQVINNCCVDSNFDVDKLIMTDLEYLFIQLRGISVNNIIDLQITDEEDGKPYNFKINVFDINVIKPKKKISGDIKISEKVGMVLEFPSIKVVDEYEDNSTNQYDFVLYLLKKSIKSIYDENEVYDPKTYTEKEMIEFIENIPPKTFSKVKAFFESAPKMEYTIEYENSNGKSNKIVLSTLEDFFTLL